MDICVVCPYIKYCWKFDCFLFLLLIRNHKTMKKNIQHNVTDVRILMVGKFQRKGRDLKYQILSDIKCDNVTRPLVMSDSMGDRSWKIVNEWGVKENIWERCELITCQALLWKHISLFLSMKTNSASGWLVKTTCFHFFPHEWHCFQLRNLIVLPLNNNTYTKPVSELSFLILCFQRALKGNDVL